MVDDVVAVGATRARAQERRTVDVAHPECSKVWHQRDRIGKGEFAV